MQRTLRVFVSSPGDVVAAREVAAEVIEKVAHEYARFLAIEPYLWEFEPMLASGHFQDSIDPPSSFDIVILILESRLGTVLPERTAVREYRGIDGRAPVTGTEWEFEDALAASRVHGVPDILVYRSRRDAEISTWDADRRRIVLAQLEALDAFWSRHFADRGTFIGGYAKFNALEELAGKLEQDLRSCVQRRIEALRPQDRARQTRLWPTAPFRGLESYAFEHAPIFFGREEAIGAALLRLITNAQAGKPFLLVTGASGSGKSSLVKAGVLPRLLVPHRVSGVAFLRRAVFRPGDIRPDEDPFDSLARCLTGGDVAARGLPELLGTSMSVGQLAAHLRESTAHPGLPFAMVLDRLAETAREQGSMLRFEQPRLILEVDQLEELFSSEHVRPEQRARFVRLLAGLVRSSVVWVIATMRSDFWHRTAETRELLELADGHGLIHLRPPAAAELSQMIRGPADAAAVRFETHAATGIPLNDTIAEAAANEPGALPLMSYLLDQLYQRDVQEGGGETLTYSSYTALGGLKGAIATRAAEVMAGQPPAVQAALRAVLFALVQMSAGEDGVERAVARRVPLAEFVDGTAKRSLVSALLQPSARLLVADAAGTQPATVRLAHEALITEWQAARDYVAGNAEALKARRMLEERYARWRRLSSASAATAHARLASVLQALGIPFGQEQGLLTDVDLTDGRRLLRDYRAELSPELTGYVDRSLGQHRRRQQRRMRVVASVAALMSVLALGASYEANVAASQRDAALQSQRRSLTQTAAARLRNADVAGAMGILLEVLGNRAGRQSYTDEALSVFQEARAADRQMLGLTGHAGRVASVVFSADGRRILTASGDHTARIWDSSTGQELTRLTGHTDRVVSAEFSADNRRVVTASIDNTVRIWDVGSARELARLRGQTERVNTAAFSPDGQLIVTASSDNMARIWDASGGQQLRELRGHTDRVSSAAFSPDGRRIVTASADKTARIWDVASGRELAELRGHADRVVSAAFSLDGQRIVTSSFDRSARVWDLATARPIATMSGHTDSLLSAAFSPDGKRVVTSSYDRTARIWDADSGKQTGLLSGHTETVNAAAFAPDGRRVASASADATVRLWDTDDHRGVLLSGLDRLVGVAFSPDGRHMLTASYDKTARIWDGRTAAPVMVLEGHTDTVEEAIYSPDGRRIATGSADTTVRLWDAASGRQTRLLRGHTDRVTNVAFAPDSSRLVTVSNDGSTRIWDIATGVEVRRLPQRHDRVTSVDYSPDGRQLLTASADRHAYVWNMASDSEILALSGHTKGLNDAEYSPDGRYIVTASSDATARIWDAVSGQELRRLSGHRDQVGVATYAPDGRYVATASADNTVRIWDAATGLQVALLSGHTEPVTGVVYSPDGARIVTAAYDGTVRAWDAQIPSLDTQLAWAEAAQFDPMTSTERFQLGIPASQGVRQWSAAAGCDQAAAAPYDPDRRAQGTPVAQIDTAIALDACGSAQAERDASGRSLYQHGRVLLAMGRFAQARRDFEQAIRRDYRSARVDLALLLSQPAAGAIDVNRALSLYEQAWSAGVPIAGFELGQLYEEGPNAGQSAADHTPARDASKAWAWYEKAAALGEPNALARFAARDEARSAAAAAAVERDAQWLDAFSYYAAAAERARLEDWPDAAWRDWRYRRASLARLLARDGMMAQVAQAYLRVRTRYAPARGLWARVRSLW